jgi:hypothetical protein
MVVPPVLMLCDRMWCGGEWRWWWCPVVAVVGQWHEGTPFFVARLISKENPPHHKQSFLERHSLPSLPIHIEATHPQQFEHQSSGI